MSGTRSLLGEQWQHGVKKCGKSHTEKAHIFYHPQSGSNRRPLDHQPSLNLSNTLIIAPIRHRHYHKFREYFCICTAIFNNGLPDISANYQIIQSGSPADYQTFWSYLYPCFGDVIGRWHNKWLSSIVLWLNLSPHMYAYSMTEAISRSVVFLLFWLSVADYN